MNLAVALRQAPVLLVVSVAVAAAAGGLWAASGGTGCRVAVSLMVVAGVLCVMGGPVLPRLGTATRVRACMGSDPGSDAPGRGESLSAVGVVILVALPLFAAGLVLYGKG